MSHAERRKWAHIQDRVWKRSAINFAVFLMGTVAISGCTIDPEPLNDSDNAARVQEDIEAMFDQQLGITGPIGLYEAIARAVHYNLDSRLKLMEQALSQQQHNISKFEMLPRATANAGYSGRSNVMASGSQDIRTGSQSLPTSTSQDRDRSTADLGTTWNILDFGVSYVAAQQQANRALIAEERRRKVIHNIIQDVQAAYWRAVAAERLLAKIDPLMVRVNNARIDAYKIESDKLLPPGEILAYQRGLTEALLQLQTLRRDLMLAKTQLAALINLRPGTTFQVLHPDHSQEIPSVPMTAKDIEQQALLNRPELREETYQQRIGYDETRKMILRMFPGIDFSMGEHYDSNKFLKYDSWADYGARVSWNLLEVLTIPSKLEFAEAQEKVIDARRLALSMAVMTQAHVAWLRYNQAVDEYRIAEQMLAIDDRILKAAVAAKQTNKEGELSQIHAELNFVISNLRRDMAYAEVWNARAGAFVTAGCDPLPGLKDVPDVQQLGWAIQKTLETWECTVATGVAPPHPTDGAPVPPPRSPQPELEETGPGAAQ